MWTAIVCTCQNRESANSFRKELLIRQQKGLLSSDAVVLAVDDPKPNIGSGSAALNALICVTECLAAREGQKVVTADALYSERILILLLGSTFPFSPCGHAFMPAPKGPQPGEDREGMEVTEVQTNIDKLITILTKFCRNSPPGVWVSSTDMLLEVPDSIESLDLSHLEDAVGALTVAARPEHAMLHGTCKITDTGEFASIVHYGNEEMVKSVTRPDGTCDMLTGIAYLSPRVAEIMLGMHTMPPLDACTYVGLDNGAQPLSLSLFFDILLCLTTEIHEDDYVTGLFKTRDTTSGQLQPDSSQKTVLERARALLWKVLKGNKLKAVHLTGVEHKYLRHIAADVLARYQGDSESGEARVINSIVSPETKIGKGSVLINCNLPNPIIVGSNCFLSGLTTSFLEQQPSSFMSAPLSIPHNLTVQEIQVSIGRGVTHASLSVVVVYGIYDNLMVPYTSDNATFCNRPWVNFFQQTGIQPAELWLPNTPPGSQTLLSARLFVASYTDRANGEAGGLLETLWLPGSIPKPEDLQRWRSAWRVSLADILRCVDCGAEFTKMRDISFELQRCRMMEALRLSQPVCLLPFFHHARVLQRGSDILRTLDEVVSQVIDQENSQLIICRIYACIADMLAFMADQGGIRGGPAANVAWKTAFDLLEKDHFVAATKALAAERDHWINDGPDRIIRASRHYERAGQILTRKAVATARQFINGTPCTPPAIGEAITVTAPARVDLAGAWTDTPPQAYEWGGVVVTLAITVNNEYPIRSSAKRITELKLVLVTYSRDGSVLQRLECTKLAHLADYSQPHAPAALLKAAVVCARIVEFPSSQSLSDQLSSKFGCGFEITCRSTLPQGSGLGTSSILGGTILAALWKAAGEDHSRDSLIHAILHLEQLLTTGGGWQDQCGGLYGGPKISHTKKGLPVLISTKQIQTPPGFVGDLSSHLLLVYTGTTRLARNLLQDVVRNWHSRDRRVIKNMQDLVDNAHAAEEAFTRGDMAAIGTSLTKYQRQKLVMAPGSMPKIVSLFIDKISQYIYGCCFAGAGGGGFLVGILKEPSGKKRVKELINSSAELNYFAVYDAAVDLLGIQYSAS